MARTKQTARMCFVPQNNKSKKITTLKPATKNGKGGKGLNKNNNVSYSSDSESDSEAHVVNNQQFSVKFDDQAKCQQNAVESQIITCTNCQAIFTSQSKKQTIAQYNKNQQDPSIPDQKKQKYLKNLKNSNSVWICEFCLTHNAIPKIYNAPTVENPCFLLEKIKQNKNKKDNTGQSDDSNKILIFCIDISGSMDLQVIGNKTRLGAVKQAIIDQINRMKFQNEVIKVGLVVFGSVVGLIGDGKTFKQKNLNVSIYSGFDKIVQQCSKINKFASPISNSYDSLKKRIQNLGVYGSTALGPGLLASIQIASKGGIGSKVIICTDGEANVGIGGSFQPNSSNFYQKAADFAKTKRVSVSILSLKGDRCNLKQLGKLSLASGGSILKIDPNALGTQFAKIAKQEILGTSSQLVIKVNNIFEVISHIPKQLSADRTTLTQQFGNFSTQTQLTFEFKVLTKQQASLKPGVDLDLFNQHQIPMQVQLTYVGRNGSKFKQVITDWRQLTEDQKQIYEGANFGLFAASVLQRASAKIKSQQFLEADKIIKGYWSIVDQKFSKSQTAQQLKKFGDRVKNIQSILNSKQKKISQKGKLLIPARKSAKSKAVTGKSSLSRDIKKKSVALKLRKRSRSRSIQKSSENSSESGMSSDQQQQILYKQMRARSRSNSPVKKQKATDKKK